jgi:hypothetical protein
VTSPSRAPRRRSRERRTRGLWIELLALALLLAPATAWADVDWARGVITERAYGTADRRAPSPAVARVAAMREAEERATAALVVAARELPRASGGTVGEAADADPTVAAALEAAAASAIDVKTELLPNGSVRVERALAIESVRQAIAGPTALAAAASSTTGGEPVTAIVVNARKLKVSPAVGIAVGDGSSTLELPSVFVRKAPAAKDARLGANAVFVDAEGAEDGVVRVPALAMQDLQGAGTLLVVVTGGKK